LILAMLLSTASLAVPRAGAAGFPDKPITIVVPFPAGSTSDTIPRMVAPLISKSLGVPVIVENRGGANGSIGAARYQTRQDTAGPQINTSLTSMR
jgi:tripartite-type tricarboxylate transporter receptor subunit TctC